MTATECPGHPAGPHEPMGETVYCDGSCQRPTASERIRAARGHDETAGDPDHNRRALGAGHVLAAGHDPDACPTCSPPLDQLASLARTALDDPAGVEEGIEAMYDALLDPSENTHDRRADRYAIEQCDRIINTLNPSEMTPATMRRALVVLGRHLAAVLDQAETEELLERDRSLIGDGIRGALDHLDQAIAAAQS